MQKGLSVVGPTRERVQQSAGDFLQNIHAGLSYMIQIHVELCDTVCSLSQRWKWDIQKKLQVLRT